MSKLDQAIEAKKGKPLIGAAVGSYNPTFLEIIAELGYDSVWIEMEHQFITFAQAEDLCRIASGLGLLTMIRIPDSRRENVLKAAECGPDIIDLPMCNTVEVVEEFVLHARYAPEGRRGFYGSSRAVRYSSGDIVEEQRRINRELCLMAQIETAEAIERLDELLAVKGIGAVLIGPGDLSASLGVPGEVGDASVENAIGRIIDGARSAGKRVAIAINPTYARRWIERGADLVYCVGDVSAMRLGAKTMLDRVLSSLS
ncbi:MAG: HpcH/HpaI aldolase family protein [Armatimonadota bacterium]